jgi:RNA polymerase sigma-70 factor (ECF subfamily)
MMERHGNSEVGRTANPADTVQESWLAFARGGSSDALGQLLEAYRGYLLRIARERIDPGLRAKEDASDLVQETFLEAQRDLPRFHGSSAGQLRAWLRQLLLNNIANLVRRYRGTDKRQINREVALGLGDGSRSPGAHLPAPTPSPSNVLVHAERSVALDRALSRLPEEYRQVLEWRYQQGLSFEEIAWQLRRSANAVRKLWARAVARLHQDLVRGGTACVEETEDRPRGVPVRLIASCL